ncbi:Multidrug resistance-associated protein 5 [Halocaridina rubra]|uniref:Multidrug resistance-associated protein 5 n=1 Tax=Halocaridina rubra TaxID=373956 RepID=A0AAN8X0I4_HALRR
MDSHDDVPIDLPPDSQEKHVEMNDIPLSTTSTPESHLLMNDDSGTPAKISPQKSVRINIPNMSSSERFQEEEILLMRAEESSLEGKSNVENEEEDEDGIGEIDQDIDDALDEGYMGMECTLERGFSLNETAIARDLRLERYDEVAVKYKHSRAMSRYRQSVKHLLPVRKPSKAKDEMPLDHSGLYSYITYSWITSLMWKAYKKGLQDEDVPICSKYDMCDYNTDRFEYLWQKELQRRGKENASFHRVVLRFVRTRLIVGLIIFIITLVLGFIGPTIFMRYLITWLSNDEPILIGLAWAFGLIFSEFVRIIMFGLVWSINYRTGIRLRAACLGLIYKKLMRLSNLGNKSIGEVINLFANDAQRIYDYVVLGPLIVGGPFVAIGGVIYILWLLGPWALFGMLTFVLFYPFQYGISRLTSYFRRRTVMVTDERVCKMNELLTFVKLIKMYAWEKSFATSISEIRSRERRLLEKSAYVQSISLAMAPTVPVLAAIVTFLAHIGAGYNLTAAQVST